ncbi:receptor-like protein kinase HERK 1 [Rutidosis leptorrhynchoides]|uniref:receptor-like protein kinase HERK 1 n=1 Tax=Rutidosis leptorrhynchoides TaxID=125765 RepID=UPI003A9992E2
MASTLTTEFSHLRIPLEVILKATNNFSDKNIIGKGGFGHVYKGKLKHHSGDWIKVAARRLNRRYGQGDTEFWTEVSVLSSVNHKNIVPMVGFCDENGEKIIIYLHYRKGSLNMHLSNTNLTSLQRSEISEGIANAINYLHSLPLMSYHVIHRNINSSTILLDDNWVPKLSGFEYSIKHPKDRMTEIYISKPIGTRGYIDPETHKIGGVTYKSDVYLMGVVFFEILCGRKAYDPDDADNKFLVQLARSHYENKTLRDIIIHHDRLWNDQEYSSKLFHYLSQAAYDDCTYETGTDRAHTSNVWGLLHSLINYTKYPNGSSGSGSALTDSVDNNARKPGSFRPKKLVYGERFDYGQTLTCLIARLGRNCTRGIMDGRPYGAPHPGFGAPHLYTGALFL